MKVQVFAPNDKPYFFFKAAQAAYEDQAFFDKYLGAIGAEQVNKTTIDHWRILLIKSGSTGEYTVAIRGTKSWANILRDIAWFVKKSDKTAKKIVEWAKENQNNYNIKVSNFTGHSAAGHLSDVSSRKLGVSSFTLNGYICNSGSNHINLRLKGCTISGLISNNHNYTTIGPGDHDLKDFSKIISPDKSLADLSDIIQILNPNSNQTSTEASSQKAQENEELTPIAEQATPAGPQEYVEPARIPVGERRIEYFDSVVSTGFGQGVSTAVISCVTGLLFGSKSKNKKEIVKAAVVEGAEIGVVAASGQVASNTLARSGLFHRSIPFVGTVVTVYRAGKKIFGLFSRNSTSGRSNDASTSPKFRNYLERTYTARELALLRSFTDLTRQEKDSLFKLLANGNHICIDVSKQIITKKQRVELISLYVKYVIAKQSLIELSAVFEESRSRNNSTNESAESDPFRDCYDDNDLFSHKRLTVRKCRALSGPGLCTLLSEMEADEIEKSNAESQIVKNALVKSERKKKRKTVVVTVTSSAVEVIAQYLLPYIGSFIASIVFGEAARRKEIKYETEHLEIGNRQLQQFSEKRIDRLNNKITRLRIRISQIKAVKASRSLLWRIAAAVAWCVAYDLEPELNIELRQLRTAKFYFQVQKISS